MHAHEIPLLLVGIGVGGVIGLCVGWLGWLWLGKESPDPTRANPANMYRHVRKGTLARTMNKPRRDKRR